MMGEIAELMIAGEQCSWCGVEFIESHGHPVLCEICFKDQSKDKKIKSDERIPRATKTELSDLDWDSSYPGGAYHDPNTGTYYNPMKQKLRPIKEYNQHSEGFTPFGDE